MEDSKGNKVLEITVGCAQMRLTNQGEAIKYKTVLDEKHPLFKLAVEYDKIVEEKKHCTKRKPYYISKVEPKKEAPKRGRKPQAEKEGE